MASVRRARTAPPRCTPPPDPAAPVVQLLLDRGAEIEARDTTWDSTPLNWALVGSGLPHVDNPTPDWTATIQTLIEADASTADITLGPDDPKPPRAFCPGM